MKDYLEEGAQEIRKRSDKKQTRLNAEREGREISSRARVSTAMKNAIHKKSETKITSR
jgi:hypothetical protein